MYYFSLSTSNTLLNTILSEYSKEAHAGLGQMYVEKTRFTAFYDREQPGTAVFLRDAILIYTSLVK
ncbi:MAG: TipAS antibiotic-recognition domain-containing protein [Eubacteriales bacterium]